MSKVRDISSENLGTIQLINKDKLFKKVKIYSYKDFNVVYCITHNNGLQISASTPQGPASKDDLISIFKKLTNKPIKNFKFLKTGRASYFIEEENNLLN